MIWSDGLCTIADGPKPRQVMPPGVAADMIKMMNSVVENGTGKRSRLDGVTSAGKTGTTNAYRDAWFMGYTANFVCGVWFGNDDYQVTNRMTGGSLPAMTWHDVMAYAHEGIEVKQLPGITVPQVRQQTALCRGQGKIKAAGDAAAAGLLTKRGADALVHVERLMDDADRALGPAHPTSHPPRTSRFRRPCLPRPIPVTRLPVAGRTGLRQSRLIRPSPAASVFSRPGYPSSESFVRLLFGTLFGLAVAAFVGLGLTRTRSRTAPPSAA